MTNVLVFGASGSVGSAAAVEARRRGAKVWLAMRDTSKKVQDLEGEEEKGGYERVQADLSDPTTIAAAVKTSGATAAFVYTLWDSPDSMKAAFETLQKAGITYLVLLGSYSVQVPAASTDMSSLVARVHATVELELEKISGLRTAVLHPAYFSSNLFLFAQGVQKGVVQLYHPNVVLDYIVPSDIGAVAGALLLTQSHDGVIPLNGRDLLSLRDALILVGRSCGKEDLKVEEVDEATFVANTASFLTEGVAKSLAAFFKEYDESEPAKHYPQHAEAVANIAKFSGREPTSLAAWAERVKPVFSG